MERGSFVLLELFRGDENLSEDDLLHACSLRADAHATVFRLRDQQEPKASLGDRFFAAVHQLESSEREPADPPAGTSFVGAAVYRTIALHRKPDPMGNGGPPSIMLVLSHPTHLGYDDLFNTWYTDNHMIDVARSPRFRGATRYEPLRTLSGTPLPYLCIYEIDAPFSPELHRGLARWLMETSDDFRQPMPLTPAGEPVLTVDFWGYFERVSPEL